MLLQELSVLLILTGWPNCKKMHILLNGFCGIILIILSIMIDYMRWAGCVALMWRRGMYKVKGTNIATDSVNQSQLSNYMPEIIKS
jgi:hypothetical protein